MELIQKFKKSDYFVFIDGSHLLSNKTSGWGVLIYKNNLEDWNSFKDDEIETIKSCVQHVQKQNPLQALYGEVPEIYLKDFEHYAMFQALSYMKKNQLNQFVIFSDLMQLETVFYHQEENQMISKKEVNMTDVFKRLLKNDDSSISHEDILNFQDLNFNVIHIDRRVNSLADKLSKQYLIDYYLSARGNIEDIKMYKNKINYFHFHDFKDGLNSTMLKGSMKKVLNALEKEHIFFDFIPANMLNSGDLYDLNPYKKEKNNHFDYHWKILKKDEPYYLLISTEKNILEFIKMNEQNPLGHFMSIWNEYIEKHKKFVFCFNPDDIVLFNFFIEHQNYLENKDLSHVILREKFQKKVQSCEEIFIFHQNTKLSRIKDFKNKEIDTEKANFDEESPINRYLFLLDKSRHSKKHINILIGWSLIEIYHQHKVKIDEKKKEKVVESFHKHYELLKKHFEIKENNHVQSIHQSLKKEYEKSVVNDYLGMHSGEVSFLKKTLYNIFDEIGLDKNFLEGKKRKSYTRIL